MSKVKLHPTQEQLKDLFSYRDGHLIHLKAKGRVGVGSIAGQPRPNGYISIGVHGGIYRAHRLIWIYHHGFNPVVDIDHIDKNKQNNNIENLRTLTRSQNLHNAKAKRGNKGGCVGVNWIKAKKRWKVSICINYNHMILKEASSDYFEACCLRKAAELKHYNF